MNILKAIWLFAFLIFNVAYSMKVPKLETQYVEINHNFVPDIKQIATEFQRKKIGDARKEKNYYSFWFKDRDELQLIDREESRFFLVLCIGGFHTVVSMIGSLKH
jgi:hypothetical protein